MINKYWFPEREDNPFLAYGEGTLPHEQLNLVLGETNINLIEDIDAQKLPIFRIQDLMMRSLPLAVKIRVRDLILEEEGISSFEDLTRAYFLLRHKKLSKSKRIRNFVEEKYAEIMNLEYVPTDDTEEIIGEENCSNEENNNR